MRFEKGHKSATRRHIIDVASKCMRRDGISATGIAGIMGEAGLTKGAFSPHFDPRTSLFARRWRERWLTSSIGLRKISSKASISKAQSGDT